MQLLFRCPEQRDGIAIHSSQLSYSHGSCRLRVASWHCIRQRYVVQCDVQMNIIPLDNNEKKNYAFMCVMWVCRRTLCHPLQMTLSLSHTLQNTDRMYVFQNEQAFGIHSSVCFVLCLLFISLAGLTVVTLHCMCPLGTHTVCYASTKCDKNSMLKSWYNCISSIRATFVSPEWCSSVWWVCVCVRRRDEWEMLLCWQHKGCCIK